MGKDRKGNVRTPTLFNIYKKDQPISIEAVRSSMLNHIAGKGNVFDEVSWKMLLQ